MPARRTNLALLGLVPLAALSGLLMFLVGSGPVWAAALLHGAVGLAVLLLVPWKSVIVRRGLRRARGGRVGSVALSVIVVLALLTGLAHVLGLLFEPLGVTVLQLHVALGIAAVPLTVVHARRRHTLPRRGDVSRRSLLHASLLAAAATAFEPVVQAVGAAAAQPGVRRSTGSYRVASRRSDDMPVTSWLLDQVPSLGPETWRLSVVSGRATRLWSLAELRRWDDRAVVVLDCTGGWWSAQEWSGVRVARLLPAGSAGSIEVTSATGYHRRLPLTSDLLLATGVGDRPLSPGHGAPLRLVVPGRRGYHWVKWVTQLEHDERPWWLQAPLPLQ